MTSVSQLAEVFKTWETPVDEDNYKTRITMGARADGRKVKITETILVTTRTRPVRNIPKFGVCAGKAPGPEPGVTFLGEEISILKPETATKKIDEPVVPDATKLLNIACGKCGGEHFTSKCASDGANLRKIVPTKGKYVPPSQRPGALPLETPDVDEPKGTPGKYIPPTRSGAGRELPPSVRVTNLPESITKEELMELVAPFGPVGRIAIPNDRRTGLPRGFAFINFHVQSDGDKAIQALNGIGYDHLILKLEWSKPRPA